VTGDETHIDRLAHFVKRYFLWLLLACYALAALFPGPGLAMRDWQWRPAAFAAVSLSLPLLLLAVMLFSAAILTDLRQLRLVSHHPFVLLLALVAVWLGPALLLLLASALLPLAIDSRTTASLLVGLALVASMPVANSSVAWTQNAGGNLGLAISLVVVSIMLSPWLTPGLLSILGMSLSEAARADCTKLVNQFSGMFFVIWVLLPTVAGALSRYLITPVRADSAKSWFALASAAALLVLNYINSALALPKISDSPFAVLVSVAALATALSLVGLFCGWLIARVLRLSAATQAALMFGLSMKHTGLALILAGAVLNREPIAILLIALATFVQHLFAGLVQWWRERQGVLGSTS
jgi:BASS family bile acid:Na+ symporter